MSAAVLVAVLVTAGVYLVLQRGLVRVTFGFILLGHAANVILLAAGGMARREPPLLAEEGTGPVADPLPQAFALTAIVITFGLTVYLLAMAGNGAEDDAPASDAEPSDAPPGTVVDEPPPDPSGPESAGPDAPETRQPISTTPTGAEPTGRTAGREHA